MKVTEEQAQVLVDWMDWLRRVDIGRDFHDQLEDGIADRMEDIKRDIDMFGGER